MKYANITIANLTGVNSWGLNLNDVDISRAILRRIQFGNKLIRYELAPRAGLNL